MNLLGNVRNPFDYTFQFKHSTFNGIILVPFRPKSVDETLFKVLAGVI
jgi:hypothetical protein